MKLPVPRLVIETGNIDGDWAMAMCHDDEMLIAGGGHCESSQVLKDSHPLLPGQSGRSIPGFPVAPTYSWFADCVELSAGNTIKPATAFAYCVKNE